ncbi:uncharacterized protein B0I36DRAFT_356326 [Microdochium trichocladiopsis]|uniref:DUF676 domain-containing protein n=1 Tax=Microdochium trichocladiopsis TaxID=1682393 RepID=A0A9P8XTW7_9PEZI|nr:uncharacterized protein B0I36DRAFT_356326 [Microdochium trichocladiopsis]KAH7012254.1 hypothetical protein B0I36DRAFT_356326 [Microdochium trichocladiopsis]
MAAHAPNPSDSNTLVPITSPTDATVDIIAVHGINVWGNETHAENTWTHAETGVNWLRTLLPTLLPRARVLAFQYNANVVFGTSTAGVQQQAVNLLGCLSMARKDNPARPLIFIAHSMGGIIVKEALATAWRGYNAYPMIWTFTYAIFFLAVPHKGSCHASWGQILADIFSTATRQPSSALLETLSRTSRSWEELNASFQPLYEAFKFYTWVESLPFGPGLGVIVPEDSAVLGLPPSRETVRTANCDHRGICKFSGDNDPEWIALAANILQAAKKAAATNCFTPSMKCRQAMFDSLGLQDAG